MQCSNIKELLTITKNIVNKSNNNPLEKVKNSLILVRSCENIGSLSGCLTGWLDTKLSEYGRKQAKFLSLEYFVNLNNMRDFSNIYVSDLSRSKETAEICLGYDSCIKYVELTELREIYFGKNEGLFYDGLPSQEKKNFNKMNYKFRGGEAWMDVKYRCIKFLDDLVYRKNSKGINIDLVFTHGGFITCLLYNKNIKTQPPPGSVIIITINDHLLTKDSELDKGKYKSLLNEFSKQYNCSDEAFNETFYNKYNPTFDEYLAKCIDNVEVVYTLPDLSDSLL
jgi:broad specificity phosphatase PhoE